VTGKLVVVTEASSGFGLLAGELARALPFRAWELLVGRFSGLHGSS
jgi:hypothetical protein